MNKADLIALLNSLPDDATEEDLIAKLSGAPDSGGGAESKEEFAAITGLLKNFGSKLDGVLTKMAAIEQQTADSERNMVLAELTQKGVVIPLSPESLRKFSAAELRTESAKWPVGEVPAEGADGSPTDPALGSVKTFSSTRVNAADTAAVAAQLGLKPEDLK